METVGRLKEGSLYIKGELNERLPAVKEGIIANYPFDGTVNRGDILSHIRYIRDWTNGNSNNDNNHWAEIQAIDENGENVALGKYSYNSEGEASPSLTDGNADYMQWEEPGMRLPGGAPRYQVVDLGDYYKLKEVIVWHYHSGTRTYYGTKTEVSRDGVNWHTIFDSEVDGLYQETPEGKRHKIPTQSLSDEVKIAGPDVIGGYHGNHFGMWIEVKENILLKGCTIDANFTGTMDIHVYDNYVYGSSIINRDPMIVQTVEVPKTGVQEISFEIFLKPGHYLISRPSGSMRRASNTQVSLPMVYDELTIHTGAEAGGGTTQGVGYYYYWFNLRYVRTDLIMENVNLDYDGAIIEQSTENMLQGPADPSSWNMFNDANEGYVAHEIIDTEFGVKGLSKTINGTSYRGTRTDINTTNSGTTWNIYEGEEYTLSLWARTRNPDGNSRLQLNFEGRREDGTRADITRNFYLTNTDWQRFTCTMSYGQSGIVRLVRHAKIYTQSMDGKDRTIDIVMPQYERNGFATHFTESERPRHGSLKLPASILNGEKGSMSMFIRYPFSLPSSISRRSLITTAGGYNNRQSLNFGTASGFPDRILGFHWGSEDGTINHISEFTTGATSSWKNEEWNHLAITWDKNDGYSVTFNGADKRSIRGISSPLVNFSTSVIQFSGNIHVKDFTTYDRELTDQEIRKLANPMISLDTKGDIAAHTLIEKPNNIPNESIYFPLGENGEDLKGFIKPIKESNPIYEDRSFWAGEKIVNYVSNPDGKDITNPIPGDHQSGWDPELHADAITVRGWSTGHNGGVKDDDLGYHGKWVYEGIDGPTDPCMKFMHINHQFEYRDGGNMGGRWQGISNQLGTPESMGWKHGDQITISWYQKSDVEGKGARVGIHHRGIAQGSNTFGNNVLTTRVRKVGVWERHSFTSTITENWSLTHNCTLYVYGYYGEYGTLWVDNVQVELKPYASPFVAGEAEPSYLKFADMKSQAQLPNQKPLSCLCWFKVDPDTGDNCSLFSCIENGGFGMRFMSDGQINAQVGNGESYSNLLSGGNYKDGQWHMAVLSIDNDDVVIYADGKEAARKKGFMTGKEIAYESSSHPMYLGSSSESDSYLNGYIRDFAVLDRTLTLEEVQKIYQTQMKSYHEKVKIQKEVVEDQAFN